MIETQYIEFIAPCFNISIGDYEVKRISSVNVISSRINPCDIAQVNIDCLDVTANDFKKDDPVAIGMGYKEMGLWNVYGGFVTDVSMQRTIQIFIKDAMVKLDKRITKTFINASPQEIITYCLQAAGISQSVLSKKELAKKHHFIVKNLTVIDTIRFINKTWGLDDWAYYFEPEGEFYWGPWEESKRYQKDIITVLETGRNIISLTPSNEETGTLETILLPFLRHSTMIKIVDPTFWRRTVTARIERLCHRVSEQKARTYIEWQILPN